MLPRHQLLVAVSLYVDTINRRCAAAQCKSLAAFALETAITNEYTSLAKHPNAWDVRSAFISYLDEAEMLRPIQKDTLLTLSQLLTRPNRLTQKLPYSDVVTISGNHAASQLQVPTRLHESVYVYNVPRRGIALANRSLHGLEPIAQHHEQLSAYYCDEPVDLVSVLSEYIVSSLKEPEQLVFHILQQWLRSHFQIPDRSDVRDLVNSVCIRINELFYGSGDPSRHQKQTIRSATLGTNLLLFEIEQTLKPRLRDATQAATAGFFLLLRLTRILRARRCWLPQESATLVSNEGQIPEDKLSQPLDCVSALRACEIGYLKNRLFGQQATTVGITYVFRGGVLMPVERGHITIIAGAPGSGKSVLALQTLADVATRGGLAVYLSLEESTTALLERLHTFGLRDDTRFVILPSSLFEFVDVLNGHSLDPDRGLLVLVDCAQPHNGDGSINRSDISIDDVVKKTSETFQHYFGLRALAIDSLNVLELPQSDSASSELGARVELRNLLDDIRNNRLQCLAVTEQPQSSSLDKLEYLADTVIHVGWNSSRGNRYLEVVKCRNQDYQSGQHLSTITDGRGIRIYPSLAAVRSTLRKRGRSVLSQQRLLRLGDGVGFDRLIEIREKGSILIDGPRGTGKSKLALHLLLEPALLAHKTLLSGDHHIAPRGVLVVTFATPESKFLQRLRLFRMRSQWDRVPFTRVRWYSPGENLAGSQIIDDILTTFAESRRSGYPLDRVLFEELEAAEHFLPSLQEDRLFWPTLVELATTEPFTTIFVARSGAGAVPAIETIRESVDYCLTISRRDEGGATEINLDKADGTWLPHGLHTGAWRYTGPESMSGDL